MQRNKALSSLEGEIAFIYCISFLHYAHNFGQSIPPSPSLETIHIFMAAQNSICRYRNNKAGRIPAHGRMQ